MTSAFAFTLLLGLVLVTLAVWSLVDPRPLIVVSLLVVLIFTVAFTVRWLAVTPPPTVQHYRVPAPVVRHPLRHSQTSPR